MLVEHKSQMCLYQTEDVAVALVDNVIHELINKSLQRTARLESFSQANDDFGWATAKLLDLSVRLGGSCAARSAVDVLVVVEASL